MEYTELLEFLKANEDKLRVFLSADERMKDYRMRLTGRKCSRTIFMSEQLQFIMTEYCIENDMKIGEFVELAIVEHLNRCGMGHKLMKIISPLANGEQGGKLRKASRHLMKVEVETQGSTGVQVGGGMINHEKGRNLRPIFKRKSA